MCSFCYHTLISTLTRTQVCLRILERYPVVSCSLGLESKKGWVNIVSILLGIFNLASSYPYFPVSVHSAFVYFRAHTHTLVICTILGTGWTLIKWLGLSNVKLPDSSGRLIRIPLHHAHNVQWNTDQLLWLGGGSQGGAEGEFRGGGLEAVLNSASKLKSTGFQLSSGVDPSLWLY